MSETAWAAIAIVQALAVVGATGFALWFWWTSG